MSDQAFNVFLLKAIQRQGLSVLQLEETTGDRIRNVLQGRQKPPLATLHRWASALHLSDDERNQLFLLADAAHGGGTLASWIVARLREADADAAALRRQIATMQRQLDETTPAPARAAETSRDYSADQPGSTAADIADIKRVLAYDHSEEAPKTEPRHDTATTRSPGGPRAGA